MLLLKLKLKNFLIYDEVDIDLSSVKLASIVGQFVTDRRRSNGAGKTAFLESIRYALYDQTRSRSKHGVIKSGAESSFVELTCDIGGKLVRVQRSRNLDGGGGAALYIDQKLIGDKIKVVNDTIQNLIGIDIELFDSIYFFKQGDHFSFAEANPTDRKNALGKVFKLDAITKCLEVTKKHKVLREKDAVKAKGAAEALGSRLNALLPYQSIVEQELAASGNLATARQLQDAYAKLRDENTLDAHDLEARYKEFLNTIQEDLNNVSIVYRAIQKTNSLIAEKQVESQRATSRINQLNQMLGSDESKIEPYKNVDVQSEINTCKISIEDHESNLSRVTKLIYSIQAEINQLNEVKVGVGAGETCPTCYQVVPKEHIKSCADKAAERIAKLATDLDQCRKVKSEIDKALSQVKDRLSQIQTVPPTLENIKATKESIVDVRKSLKLIDSQIETLTDQRNELCQRQNEIEARVDQDLVIRYRNAVCDLRDRAYSMLTVGIQRRCDVIRRDVEKYTTEDVKLVKTLQDAKRQAADYEVALEAQRQAESVLSTYEVLCDIFGRNGIQAIMIENAIGVVETFANDILKQMQTRFVLSLRTTKETKAGDQRESLDIIVFDNGSEKQFESYSGGEKALINIALRLSLSKVISALHGIKMQSLFLDEVLGALDGPNREEVVKILSYLSRSFEQVFVVSHTDEIQDVIDSSIVIERHDNHSEIKLTHDRR